MVVAVPFSSEAYDRAKASLHSLRNQAAVPDAAPSPDDSPVDDVDKALLTLQRAVMGELDRFGVRWSAGAAVQAAFDDVRSAVNRHVRRADADRHKAVETATKLQAIVSRHEEDHQQQLSAMRQAQATMINKAKAQARANVKRICQKERLEVEEHFRQEWERCRKDVEAEANSRAMESLDALSKTVLAQIEGVEASYQAALHRHLADKASLIDHLETSINAGKDLLDDRRALSRIVNELEQHLLLACAERSRTTPVVYPTGDDSAAAIDEVLGQEAERTRARLKRIRATHADAVRQIRMEHERELGAVDIRVRKLIAAKDADIAALQRSLDTLTRALTSDVS
ncbi:Uncharacterized protein PBTT_04330 [Plasmodiophora brassicae]|uniref:Uncharacterized protein n=2 Tax=Plasmodiophora brassicae TaxID=37360 RepID=A0A3P3Y9I3_PLABS|nr:unnamed protein product [Plasmodiophora brassicae]